MVYRLMALSDYERLIALWRACEHMGLNDVDDSRAGIERFLARNPNTCFVAEADGAIAGAALAGHDGRRGHIYHLAVREACRRKGVGAELVERCLDALKAEGIAKVSLVAFRDNDSGNAFWRRVGFEPREDLTYHDRTLTEIVRTDT